MFNTDLHREYMFISYLLGLIPAETTAMIDLEGKLQLEYYKLQKTFEGAIELEEATGAYFGPKATPSRSFSRTMTGF